MKLRINLFLAYCLLVTLAVSLSTVLFLAQMRSEVFHLADTELEEAIKTFSIPYGVKKSEFLASYNRLKLNMITGTVAIEVLLLAIGFALLRERSRHEDSLQEQLLFLQTLIDTIPSPIFYKDRQGRYLGYNRAFEDSIGLTRDQLIGKSVYDVAPRDLADKYHEMDEALFTNPGNQVYDSSVVYANGSRHDVIFTKATFTGKDGTVAGLVGVMLDVTERKRVEDALRESDERFHQIFAQNDDAIILFRTDDFRIIDANPAAEELYGLVREELVNLTPRSLIEPADFDKLMGTMPVDDVFRGFQLDRAHATRKDGTSIIVAIRGKILRLREAYVVYCSIRDITERVRLKEEVGVAQAKLIHANKMTSLGMLASSVAHEINNPNNYICANAAMLADAWQDATTILRRFLDQNGDFPIGGLPFSEMEKLAPRLFSGITEGSRRINAIVTNMKDYVKTDGGSPHAEFDVNSAVQDAKTILWHHIHKYTDNFTLTLAEDLPPARGNRQQIEQVVINLITNALQSLPGKNSGVSVETGFERGAGALTVAVRDKGKGMSGKVLQRLTEPFFTTRGGEGGTGLGLYISASIIKEHGGSLEFDSLHGRGTTVTIRLPVAGKAS